MGGEVSLPQLVGNRYHTTIAHGLRATVYDHTINVYDKAPGTEFAYRPLDNVGIQYGLAALNRGEISNGTFIQFHRDIGGFDVAMNHIAERHNGISQAVEIRNGSVRSV